MPRSTSKTAKRVRTAGSNWGRSALRLAAIWRPCESFKRWKLSKKEPATQPRSLFPFQLVRKQRILYGGPPEMERPSFPSLTAEAAPRSALQHPNSTRLSLPFSCSSKPARVVDQGNQQDGEGLLYVRRRGYSLHLGTMASTRPGRLHPTSTWAGAFVQHHPAHRLMMRSMLEYQPAKLRNSKWYRHLPRIHGRCDALLMQWLPSLPSESRLWFWALFTAQQCCTMGFHGP